MITDLCVIEPDPETKELVVTSLHPDVSRARVTEETGWPVRFAAAVQTTSHPTPHELAVLRELQARTAARTRRR